jgi:hypothetical protein
VDLTRVEHTVILAYCQQEMPSNVAAAMLPLHTALLAYARQHVFVFQVYTTLWHPSCIWCLQSAGGLPRFRHSKERCLRLDPGRCNESIVHRWYSKPGRHGAVFHWLALLFFCVLW